MTRINNMNITRGSDYMFSSKSWLTHTTKTEKETLLAVFMKEDILGTRLGDLIAAAKASKVDGAKEVIVCLESLSDKMLKGVTKAKANTTRGRRAAMRARRESKIQVDTEPKAKKGKRKPKPQAA